MLRSQSSSRDFILRATLALILGSFLASSALAQTESTARDADLPEDPRGKIVRPTDLAAEVRAGFDRFTVTIEITAPPAIENFSAWADLDARVDHRARVAARQAAVVAGWPGAEIRVLHRLENQPSFSLEITRAGLALLLDDPAVQSIVPVQVMRAATRQGIPLMAADRVRWATAGGAGISIAICDTGVDYTHPDLGAGAFPNSKVIGGFDFGDSDADPLPGLFIDGHHGTSVAGIAAGDIPVPVAPGPVSGDYIGGMAHGARLYALKITPGLSGLSNSGIIAAAWDWCVTHQLDDPAAPILVINTSFGGGQYFTACDTLDPVVANCADIAKAAGISVVCSSGNEGYCNAMTSPACLDSTIAVGATYDNAIHRATHCVDPASCTGVGPCAGGTTDLCIDQVVAAGTVTCYSNSSNELDLVAPSDRADTTDVSGLGGVSLDDYANNFNGTSAAAPYVAGAIAIVQSAATQLLGSPLSPDDVLDALQSTGTPVTDPKSGITVSLPDVETAITEFSPKWGLNNPLTDLAFQANGLVYADGCTGGKDPIPGAFETDMAAVNGFFLAGGAFTGRLGLRANDDPPPVPYTSADSFQLLRVFGFGTPFLTLEWRSNSACRTLEDDYSAWANGALSSTIDAAIFPSASTPPGTPVNLMTLLTNRTNNNVQSEAIVEDDGCVMFDLVVNSVDLDNGFFDIPDFDWPQNTRSQSLNDSVSGVGSSAVGQTITIDLDIDEAVEIRSPGKLSAGLFDDIIDAGAIGTLTVSLIAPPPGNPLPPAPPVPPIPPRGIDVAFSVDIGGDTELSDFAPDGNETFDPGDLYPLNGPLLPFGGADGSTLDDEVLFAGVDPAPDPAIGTPSAPITCQFVPLLPAFDLLGVDQVDLSFVPIFAPATLGPIGRFPSACIPSPDHLLISFDEDGALPFAGGPGCDTPLGSTAPAGSDIAGDEIMVVEIVPGIPTSVIEICPLLSETKVHPNLLPPPDFGVFENDDVDALSAQPAGTTCEFIHFTVDHEAPGSGGFSPGFIYEYDPVNASVTQIVDPQLHLGLPASTEIDSIEWSFFQNLTPIGGSLTSGLDGLVLLFSVNSDDPTTALDESGGLLPDSVYASYLDGTHFVFLPHLAQGPATGSDVDAIAAVEGDVRDSDYQLRYASTVLSIGFDPGTGSGAGSVQISIEEDPRSPGFPTPTVSFSMALSNDPNLVMATNVTLLGPVDALVQSSAGFFLPQIFPDGVSLEVIYDPGGGATLDFSTATPAVQIDYQTNPATLQGISFPVATELRWSNATPTGIPNRVITPAGFDLLPRVDDIFVSLSPVSSVCFARGDCNDDGMIDISDPIAVLTILFSGALTQCPAACDWNGSGPLDIADAIYGLSFLFGSGPPPPAPYPACGVAPGVNCSVFSSCPSPCP